MPFLFNLHPKALLGIFDWGFFFFYSIVTLICKESSIRTAAHFMIAIYGSFQNNNTSRQEQKGFMEFNSELLLLLLLLNLFIY